MSSPALHPRRSRAPPVKKPKPEYMLLKLGDANHSPLQTSHTSSGFSSQGPTQNEPCDPTPSVFISVGTPHHHHTSEPAPILPATPQPSRNRESEGPSTTRDISLSTAVMLDDQGRTPSLEKEGDCTDEHTKSTPRLSGITTNPSNRSSTLISPCEVETDASKSLQTQLRDEEPNIAASDVNDTESQSKGNVLYKLVCRDMENRYKDTMRYSWKPFEGLLRDQDDDKNREQLAPIDVIDLILGLPLKGRQSQNRHNFGTAEDKDPGPYIVGVDFFSRSHPNTSIRIFSPHLLHVIQTLVLYYPQCNLQSKELLVEEPFQLVFHYWDQLTQISDAFGRGEASIAIKNPETGSEALITCEENTKCHLDILMNCAAIQKAFTSTVSPARALYEKGLATFDNIWLMFRPGDIVFNRVRGRLAGSVVEIVTYNAASITGTPHANDKWELRLWNLEYKNRKLIRESHTFYINRYHGQKRIPELPMFPITFMHDDGALKKDLINRGERYYRILCDEKRHMFYDGLTISEKRPYSYRGEIIVDHDSYMLESSSKMEMMQLSGETPEDTRGEPLFSKFNDMECSLETPLIPEQYLLLPGYVLGFALGKKEWEVFDMSCVSEIADDNDPMEYLKIDKRSSDLILSAAGKPAEGGGLKPWAADWSADYIEGKGKGKVMLLHGPPGTGKTMTAECVAKWTKRPLLSISAADLGTEEITMEKNLVRWLDRATMWGAIVLIDEAEVYLEQRQTTNLTRNALVTAFLRTMEYFPGLLFLTSNGIGLFDEAVLSRIHLSIRYERPNKEQRIAIWSSLLDKLTKDQEEKKQEIERNKAARLPGSSENKIKTTSPPRIVFSTDATNFIVTELGNTEYGNLPLNGRDIRNILMCAISIGQKEYDDKLGKRGASDTVKVTRQSLKDVLRNKADFREDFRRARGHYPEEAAAQEFWRQEQSKDEVASSETQDK